MAAMMMVSIVMPETGLRAVVAMAPAASMETQWYYHSLEFFLFRGACFSLSGERSSPGDGTTVVCRVPSLEWL
jgi:TRAP-type mannitol/chloroaromatic compound transport system permease small subunit